MENQTFTIGCHPDLFPYFYDREFFKIEKVPHAQVCPVCGGNGLVSNGFYNQTSRQWNSSDATPETCRSCIGSGWVTV